MKHIKLISLILAAVFCLFLTGCDTVGSGVDKLIVPPKLEGDLYPVQQALEDSAGDNLILKYPLSGLYRSAFILKDLDGDGRDEAIALYGIAGETSLSIHINVISSDGDEWKSRGDLSLIGSDVESVTFADLDNDGTLEIIVGWMVYGTVDKKVGVYTFDGTALIQRALEPYTNFLCAELTDKGGEDLVVLHLNTTEKTAGAKVFSLTKEGISELGSVALDGGVSSYLSPVVSTLTDGTPALYVDALKGNGILTEIVWFNEGVLSSLFDPAAPEAQPTYRTGTVSSRDFDGDGIIDIPLLELLESTADLGETDKVYYTNWCSFSGSNFRINQSVFMNYTDGYGITVPTELKKRIFLLRNTETRMRTLFSYDPETEMSGEELFRILAVNPADYESGQYESGGFTLLEKTETIAYLAAVNPDNTLGITLERVTDMFDTIQ